MLFEERGQEEGMLLILHFPDQQGQKFCCSHTQYESLPQNMYIYIPVLWLRYTKIFVYIPVLWVR